MDSFMRLVEYIGQDGDHFIGGLVMLLALGGVIAGILSQLFPIVIIKKTGGN